MARLAFSSTATLALLRGYGMAPADVDLVGTAGQTIWHAPEPVVAELTTAWSGDLLMTRATLAIGPEEELAALSLGASGWQMFRRVTLPNIRWGVLYGVILCNARAMGEFGAVYVVSGHVASQTDTVPLRVEK